MYEKYWGLGESPFQNRLDERWFYESPVHEEALARLLFLIEQRRRFGLLTGTAGTGKSLLLHVLAGQVLRTQRKLAVVDALGIDADELLWQLGASLGIDPDGRLSRRRLWQSLQDQLKGLQTARIQTVIVLDHLDRAESSCLTLLERLHHAAGDTSVWTTFLVASRRDDPRPEARILGDLADLSVKLPPLDRDETGRYISELSRRAGSDRELFAPSAVESIHDCTGGIPRDVNRLCDLCLLAGIQDEREIVDAAVVDSVADEFGAKARSRSPGRSVLQELRW